MAVVATDQSCDPLSLFNMESDFNFDPPFDLSALTPPTTDPSIPSPSEDDFDFSIPDIPTNYSTPESRWLALQTRDPAADLAFVYCVITTRIYCRPVCKARLPRRANVTFFSYPWDAAAAGFRACKRCKPDVVDLMPANAANASLCRVVTEAVGSGEAFPRAEELAKRAGVSKWHLQRVFKRVYGVTPRAFAAIVAANQPPPTPAMDLEDLLSPGTADQTTSTPLTPKSVSCVSAVPSG